MQTITKAYCMVCADAVLRNPRFKTSLCTQHLLDYNCYCIPEDDLHLFVCVCLLALEWRVE